MEARLIIVCRRWRTIQRTEAGNSFSYQPLRQMTQRASDRAAVHGSKLPDTGHVLDEEVEKTINKGKEDKERKRREVEDKVDHQSQAKGKGSEVLADSDSG